MELEKDIAEEKEVIIKEEANNDEDNNEENEEVEEDEAGEQDENDDNENENDNEDDKEEKESEQEQEEDKNNPELQFKQDSEKISGVEFNTRKLITADFKNYLKEDSNKGVTSLQNLGNTCYLNCAIQCLSHSTDLTYFFLSGIYQEEINPKNRKSPSKNLSITTNLLIRGQIF